MPIATRKNTSIGAQPIVMDINAFIYSDCQLIFPMSATAACNQQQYSCRVVPFWRVALNQGASRTRCDRARRS